MSQKKINNKDTYSITEHAIAMFRENYNCLMDKKDEFNILHFSERYYEDNKDCFRHKGKLEVRMFITELITLKYIRLHDKAYNIVVITEKGHAELSTWKTHWDKIYGRI